jgi:hypothetical protein
MQSSTDTVLCNARQNRLLSQLPGRAGYAGCVEISSLLRLQAAGLTEE